jgi:uroporphyrinogen III methyltransferase / synthase
MRSTVRVGEERANSLKGKRVVVTRATEQSESLVQALRDMGAVPVVLPMVAFGAPDDLAAVDEAIRGAGRYDWMLLTSQNALRALQERCGVLGIGLATAMGGIRIAAVGPTTADAARNAGLKLAYAAEKHHGAALAEELGERIRGKRILLPRSDRANPDLVEKLEGLGAQVKEIVAYKTVRPDEGSLTKAEEMAREGADAVLFFSPSAVHHLEGVLGNARFLQLSKRAVFTAIGPVTEVALRKAKVERVVMAEDTTVGAVLTALTDYFTASGKRLPAGAKLE